MLAMEHPMRAARNLRTAAAIRAWWRVPRHQRVACNRRGNDTQPAPPRDEAFRLLVEAVIDYAIFLLDPDGHVLTWNQGAERIKGYSADEIVGRHFSAFYTDADRAAGRPSAILGQARRDGRTEDQGWRVRKDGSHFWADVIVTALRNPDGSLYGYAKVTRDATDRRAAEQRERQLAIEQEARAAAEEALRARDHFLTVASHELKTPVASLQLAAEALTRSRESGTLTDERLDSGLGRLTAATTRLAALLSELLDVSRLTATGLPIQPVRSDLAAIAREVVAELAEAAADRRVRVDAPEPVTVSVDQMRIRQVVTNLVDNALKYSGAGTAIDVRVRETEGGGEIEVADEGVGLDATARRELFEPFGRGDSTSHIPGMGLGLFISRQIVERHGGSLRASSDGSGRGTTMTVSLPREPGGARRDAEDDDAEQR
jgi:PAS domain S-box-containing protein